MQRRTYTTAALILASLFVGYGLGYKGGKRQGTVEYQAERFRSCADTMAEQARRVQEASDVNSPDLASQISTMNSYARRMQNLPNELEKK